MPNLKRHILTTICFALYILLAEYVMPSSKTVLIPFMALILLLPGQRLIILAISNIFFGIFGISFWTQFLGDFKFQSGILEITLAFLAALGFFYLFALLTIRWPRHLAIFVLMGIVLIVSFFHAPVSKLVDSFCIALIQGVFFNCYYLRMRSTREEIRPINFLANQHSFYYGSVVPTPALIGDQIEQQSPTQRSVSEVLKCRVHAVRLLLAVAAAVFVLNNAGPILVSLFSLENLSPDHIPHFLDLPLSLSQLISGKTNLLQRWTLTILMFISWLLKSFSFAGIAVATCRMIGIPAKASVYDLFGARTMYQFFERYSHYYCRLMLDIFVYPTYRLLAFLKNGSGRTMASFAIGILICGIVMHHFILVGMIYYYAGTQAKYPTDLLSPAFYWALLATAISSSIYLERKHSIENRNRLLIAARWILYFVFASSAFIFIQEYFISIANFQSRLNYFLSLFGFLCS